MHNFHSSFLFFSSRVVACIAHLYFHQGVPRIQHLQRLFPCSRARTCAYSHGGRRRGMRVSQISSAFDCDTESCACGGHLEVYRQGRPSRPTALGVLSSTSWFRLLRWGCEVQLMCSRTLVLQSPATMKCRWHQSWNRDESACSKSSQLASSRRGRVCARTG